MDWPRRVAYDRHKCLHLSFEHGPYVSDVLIAMVECFLNLLRSWFLVDRWGRRAILMSGGSVVSTFLARLTACIKLCLIDGCRFNNDWVVDVH